MLATSHIIAGAAIGGALRRPWLALPAAFLSHFALDFVPHLDSHGLFGRPGGSPTRPEAAMAVMDTLAGVALVLWAVRGHPRRRRMLGAAFLGITIDLVDNVPPWGPRFQTGTATAWLSAFHHGIQHNVVPAQWPLGFGTQIAVVLAALWGIQATAKK